MNIDWSKAPEDATHAGNSPYEKGVVTWFKGISDPASRNYFMNEGSMNAWAISSENLSAWDLIDRPKKQYAWDGVGLPPTGIECEVLWSITHHTYVTCLIIAHDEDRAVFRFTSGPQKGAYHSEIIKDAWMPFQSFRPIKTAEQMAEEEKKKVIDDMQRIYEESMLDYSSRLGHASRPAIKALYEAGYRKQ